MSTSTTNEALEAVHDIPAIVVLIADRPAAAEYGAAFEAEGLWVSRVTDEAEAVTTVRELRPDVVVADLRDGNAGRRDVLRVIKHTRPIAHIPVVALCDGSADQRAADADLRLESDLPARQLVGRVVDLVEQSADQKPRLDSEAPTGDERENRACPKCGRELSWIERGRLGGVRYDYYRWCRSGCGLYCYELGADKWLKLT